MHNSTETEVLFTYFKAEINVRRTVTYLTSVSKFTHSQIYSSHRTIGHFWNTKQNEQNKNVYYNILNSAYF